MRTLQSIVLVFALCLSFVQCSVALATTDTVQEAVQSNVQQHAPEADGGDKRVAERKNGPAGVGESSPVGWLSSLELWLSLSVLCFGLITVFVELSVIKAGAFKPDDSIKLLAVTLIVISTLFIITAGFDSEQIAPAMGLFGTVAGYMLGKATPPKDL